MINGHVKLRLHFYVMMSLTGLAFNMRSKRGLTSWHVHRGQRSNMALTRWAEWPLHSKFLGCVFSSKKNNTFLSLLTMEALLTSCISGIFRCTMKDLHRKENHFQCATVQVMLWQSSSQHFVSLLGVECSTPLSSKEFIISLWSQHTMVYPFPKALRYLEGPLANASKNDSRLNLRLKL